MKTYKDIYRWTYPLIACILLIAGGCSDNGEIDGRDYRGYIHVLRFTDNFTKDAKEVITLNADAQTISLKVKAVEDIDIPIPTNLDYTQVAIWNEETDRWESVADDIRYPDGNKPGSFYHVDRVEIDGETSINISLTANNSEKERKISLTITGGDGLYMEHYILAGYIEIIQLPASSEADNTPEAFSLRARYKGEVYSTEASIDDEGNYVYENPEYKALMDRIDADPSAQMLIMDDETICYYDKDDIADNRPYEDICALSPLPATRATGFESIKSTDLAFVGLFDNDHFGGSNVTHGLPQYDYTWNIPTMNWYSLNDKITSIALGYNGKDALVCSVLTIWDDSNYNHGDNDRKKHRISIVASKNSPRTGVADLKKVKKIGSSKSWNDCISSVSLHFGYTDRLLRDY